MRSSRVLAFVFGVLLVTVAHLVGQDKKPADPPVPSLEDLVADLGHPVFAAREKAQRELWKRGDAAIPLLEKARKDENPELARRAGELLDKFAWGIRPDTPPAVLKLLRQFQAGDDKDPQKAIEMRKAAILELLKFGPQGVSVVRALLGKNLTPEVHEQVVVQVTAMLRREVPLRLFEGKVDGAAELIAIHAAGTGPEGAADFAAFQVLRGNLPAAIIAAETALKTGRHVNNHKIILAHLYRASGDWAKARAAAADLPHPPETRSLTELLTEEEGDWATLADKPVVGTNHPDAVLLTLLRLAGRQKAFDDEASRVKRQADEFASPDDVLDAAIALFANHRVEDGMKVLLERKQNLGLLAEVLISRLRFKEALAITLPEMVLAQEKLAFDLRRARILVLTGQRDDAVQLFSKVAEGLRRPREGGDPDSQSPVRTVRSLLRTEMRVGLKDLTAEHAAQFLTAGTFRDYDGLASGESAFEILFGQDSTVGETLFWALREKKIPGNEPGPTMSRVRDLLTGKANKAAVDETLKTISELGDPLNLAARDSTGHRSWLSGVRRSLAVAAVCRAARRDVDAETAFKAAATANSDYVVISGARSWVYGTSDSHRPWIEWGDFLYDQSRFREAATRFEEGWKRYPGQPLLLFLSGKALVKAGDVKEGERRIELSHWVSLGQERIRGRFLDELVRRGEGKAAKRETELILRACWSRDHYFGNVMNQASHAALLNQDFDLAEKCVQRSLLVMLWTPGVYFVETSAYVNVPHDMLIYRTRARLAAGKVDEAVALAREALATTPGHLDLVSGMVPELDRLGKKTEADELFGKAWTAYQKMLTEFPNSPAARNALATLAANCRRELDKGQTHALAAVKADPGSLPYRETLAEVYFRRGEREKAIEVMARLVEDEPRNRFFQRQLVRYRKGSIDSPKPERADE